MINIQQNISLKHYNTFGIDVNAKFFSKLSSTEEIKEFCSDYLPQYEQYLILGSSSNILFTKDFDGIVFTISIKGIEVIHEDENNVILKAGSGEIWDELVEFCVNNNFGGIENLSNIPGTVGAAPIQNIGAYGVELKDVFLELEAVKIRTGKTRIFSNNECLFDYRNSVFKNELKGQYIITSVTLRLSKSPVLLYEYGAMRDELMRLNIENPVIKDIRQVVINIRSSKLPDPEIIGNAGSFFKNPVVKNEKLQQIKQDYPDIPSYKQDEQHVKLAAGWLIEKCGWKGKRIGNAGVHKDQALVLVNHGGATGKEILELSKNIQRSVLDKFGVELVPEVNII